MIQKLGRNCVEPVWHFDVERVTREGLNVTEGLDRKFLKNRSDGPRNIRTSLSHVLDFKSADIESIEPTFVCIRSLRSDPPPIPNSLDSHLMRTRWELL